VKEAIRAPIRRAAEAIAGAGHITAVGHVNPDGDALGSSLALALSARRTGLPAVASFGGDFVVPDVFRFLDLAPLVPPAELPDPPDVMVVFDVASPDRLGGLATAAAAARLVVVVDHHASNSGFGDVQVIDPEAGASAQLAYHLIRELGWPIDRAVGDALLTGIVTDTGRFQYSATDPDIHRVAADLLEAGVRPEVLGQHLFESVPYGYLQVSSRVLGRSRLEPDAGLVWSVALEADLEAAGVGWEDCDGLIDDLRIVREAEVAALLKEVAGGYKVSLRSRGGVDVGSIAAANGGGGHHNAAGFTAAGRPDEVIARVRSAL
jgi:phosphoesterase RecJ-like protein